MIINFLREKSSIYLKANEETIKKVSEQLRPFFKLSNNPDHFLKDWTILCLSSEEANLFNDFSLKEIKLAQNPEPDFSIYFNGNLKIVGVKESIDDEWLIQNIIRIIRVLSRFQLGERGELFIHGGLIKSNGKGICFVGEKKSGKTSSIISYLKSFGGYFISNDDVSVSNDDSGFLIGKGWPRSIVIRQDTITNMNFKKSDKLNHPLNERLENCFYPKEFVTWLNVKILSETTIDYIIFPKFEEINYPKIEEMGFEEGINRLKQHFQNRPGKYVDYLVPWFKLFDFEYNQNLFENSNIKFLELKQNFKDLELASELLNEYIQ